MYQKLYKFRAFPFQALIITIILSCFSYSAIAAKKLCAIYPHLKDSYWLSVNYGMVSEAKKLNINLRVLESGGYPHLKRQQRQLQICHHWGADAIILGTVGPDVYKHNLSKWVGNTPVFATVNKLNLDKKQHKLLKGVVGVDWYWMGYKPGEYLAQKHPKGSGKTNVVLLVGPNIRGGTKPIIRGFNDAIKHSDIVVVRNLSADNDKELQRDFVQKILEIEDVDYIVGSSVAIEAAISELRSAHRTNNVHLVASYLSHGVYRGLLRNKVEFSPTDQMVEQGRLSVRQATNFLRHLPFKKNESPKIYSLTPKTLNSLSIKNSLSPSEFRPTFQVKAD